MGDSIVNEFQDLTTVHPVGALAVIVLGICTLLLPRRHAVLPFVLLACLISPAQRVVVGGLDFNFIRLLVLAGWARVLLRQEFVGFRWRATDTVVVLWAAIGTLAYTITFGSISAFINKLGTTYDAVGLYFFFRCVVRSMRDLIGIATSFAMVSLPVAMFFAIEKATGRNMFSVFGGVPEITLVRNGRLRCQGAFPHPIMAGSFWAAAAPIMGALWWVRGTSRVWAVVGVLNACLIVIFTWSSTPLLGFMMAIFASMLFPVRRWLGVVRWGVVTALVFLHFAREKPIWHLISRINITGGSTGWHRYNLVDQAINRVGEWWLTGTTSTAHWGDGLQDVTNQYVLEGVRGGMLTLVLFIATMVLAYREVGRAMRRMEGSPIRMAMVWAMGVSLFVHTISFLAVSYFGQIMMLWYLSLAGSVCVGLIPSSEQRRRVRKISNEAPDSSDATGSPAGAIDV